MQDTPPKTHNWYHVGLIVVLFPLGITIDSLLDATSGSAALMAVLGPCFLAATTGQQNAIRAALALGIACLLAEPFLQGNSHVQYGNWIVAALAAGTLLTITLPTSVRCRRIIEREDDLQAEVNRLVRQVYEHSRAQTEPNANERTKSTRSGSLGDSLNEDNGGVNYPMLLLTIQDIGRRISTNLDLDSLYRTITSTAQFNLKCGQSRILVWNPAQQQLRKVAQAGNADSASAGANISGSIAWVLDQKQMLTRSTVESDTTLRALFDGQHVPAAIAPLKVGEELLGLLIVDDVEDDSQTFVRLLYVLSNFSALAIKNAQLFRRIDDMARRDGMTGMLNHTAFQVELESGIERLEENGVPLSLVMGDIDHFKRFNDTYGHQAGDEVLKHVAAVWKATLPVDAVLGRYGGEEFIALLPGRPRSQAHELAETLRRELESFHLDFEGQTLRITSSFGVAECDASQHDATSLVRELDEALYASKDGGRNRVTCAGVQPSSLGGSPA